MIIRHVRRNQKIKECTAPQVKCENAIAHVDGCHELIEILAGAIGHERETRTQEQGAQIMKGGIKV